MKKAESYKIMASLFRVLSHPARVQLICALLKQEHDVSELQHLLGISQSNVSQHLSLLKAQKIVSERREGKHIYYSIKSPQVASVLVGALQVMSVDLVADTEMLTACTELMTLLTI